MPESDDGQVLWNVLADKLGWGRGVEDIEEAVVEPPLPPGQWWPPRQ